MFMKRLQRSAVGTTSSRCFALGHRWLGLRPKFQNLRNKE